MTELPRLLLCAFEVVPSPTGTSRRITEYLRAVADRFQVIVLSTKTSDLSHIAKYENARLLRVPLGEGDLASRIDIYDRATRRQLASEEYALVHFFDPYCGYTVCEQKPNYSYKVVYEAARFPSQELGLRRPSLAQNRKLLSKLRRQELFCLMNADLVLTGSEVTRKFIHSLGVAQEAVEVVRSPVDLAAARADEPPASGPLELVYVGSQSAWNDLSTVYAALPAAAVPLRLRVVGPEPEEPVAGEKLPPNVERLPAAEPEALIRALSSAHACLAPLADVERNRIQGTPLAKVSDYFAAGRPVIAADLPAARELVPDSAALFYRPGDAKSLAACIAQLAKDSARRSSLGQSARAYAERHLDSKRIGAQLLAAYAKLLGREIVGASVEELAPIAVTNTGTPTSRALPSPQQAAASSGAQDDDTDQAVRPVPVPVPVVSLPGARERAASAAKDPGTDRAARPAAAAPLASARETPSEAAKVSAPSSGAVMSAPPPQPPRLPSKPRVRSGKTPMPRRTPGPARLPNGAPLSLDDIEEISADEVMEADDEPAASLPGSKIDPWFAQLVYGYCPPAVTFFARHTPPTNFPGRERDKEGR